MIANRQSTHRQSTHSKIAKALRLFIWGCLLIDLVTLAEFIYNHFRFHTAAEMQIISTPADRFGDFWHYHALFSSFHTNAFFTSADRFAYPAPCAVIYSILYRLGPHPFLVFACMIGAVWLASGLVFRNVLMRFRVASSTATWLTLFLLLTSYPWEKLFDRANLELFVYVFLALGTWAWIRGKTIPAAILWGLAGAMKIYPLVMLAIFFQRKTLKPLAAGFATFAVTLFLSFWYVGPTIRIAAMGSIHGMTGFLGNYAAGARVLELTIDHSILGAVKEFLLITGASVQNFPHLSTDYQILVAIAAPVLFLLVIRRLPLLNQLCLFLISITVLPPVSYDYTLVHLYLVFGIVCCVYLRAAQRPNSKLRGIYLFAVLFALLFSPEVWATPFGYGWNGLIKCVAILALAVALMRIPLSLETETMIQN